MIENTINDGKTIADGDGAGFVFDCRAMPNPYWNDTQSASASNEKEYDIIRAEGKHHMALSYTYWQDPNDGLWVGYWNDYPDHPTQGHTLDELQHMLRSLRSDIAAMIADGTWSESPRSVAAMEFA